MSAPTWNPDGCMTPWSDEIEDDCAIEWNEFDERIVRWNEDGREDR